MESDFSYLRDHYPPEVTSDQVRQMLHIKPDRSHANSPASEIFLVLLILGLLEKSALSFTRPTSKSLKKSLLAGSAKSRLQNF